MLIAYLRGGLANQLFQYATIRSLAFKTKQNFLVRPKFNNDPIVRPYSLPKLGLNPCLCIGPKKVLTLCLKLYKEKSLRYDPNVSALKNARLHGYWQSEKYFLDIKAHLQKDLFHNIPISQQSQKIANEIDRFDSLSIHVRRGDYVNPRAQAYHGLCKLDYYTQAVELWLKRKNPSRPHAFVFSDDPSWTQANLRLKIPVTYVTHNGPEADHEDLWLMSRNKNHIIANSSFSWWGAWLHEKEDSFIVAPRLWFSNPKAQSESVDIVPERWIRI